MQQLLYLQATGKELRADTAAERKEQLRIKLAGKRILVVLDDLVGYGRTGRDCGTSFLNLSV